MKKEAAEKARLVQSEQKTHLYLPLNARPPGTTLSTRLVLGGLHNMMLCRAMHRASADARVSEPTCNSANQQQDPVTWCTCALSTLQHGCAMIMTIRQVMRLSNPACKQVCWNVTVLVLLMHTVAAGYCKACRWWSSHREAGTVECCSGV